MIDKCRFDNTPGAPPFYTSGGSTTSLRPTQPLSDVKSISNCRCSIVFHTKKILFLVLAVPTSNGEVCDLPYFYGTDTWQTHFCRFDENMVRTCPTRSGIGTCNHGKDSSMNISMIRYDFIFKGWFGLITTTQAGYHDHLYTTINTVNGVGNAQHCLDMYYYLTNRTNNAKISIAWHAGLGPTLIETVTAQGDKWERLRKTFSRPSSDYYVSDSFY